MALQNIVMKFRDKQVNGLTRQLVEVIFVIHDRQFIGFGQSKNIICVQVIAVFIHDNVQLIRSFLNLHSRHRASHRAHTGGFEMYFG